MFLFTCFKSSEKIDNEHKIIEGVKYSDTIKKYENEIKDLELMLNQAKEIIYKYEIQIKELDDYIKNKPVKKIKESLQSCKSVPDCQHISCDFNPMLTTIKQLKDELSEFKKLYNSSLEDYNNKTRSYTETIKQKNYSLNIYKNKLEETKNIIYTLNDIVEKYNKYIQQLSFENQMFRNYNQKLIAEYDFLNNSLNNKITRPKKLECIHEDKPMFLSYT